LLISLWLLLKFWKFVVDCVGDVEMAVHRYFMTGEVLRCSTGCSQWQDLYNEWRGDIRNVTIQFGNRLAAHGLMGCCEEGWDDTKCRVVLRKEPLVYFTANIIAVI
jgi:hypothetical protein